MVHRSGSSRAASNDETQDSEAKGGRKYTRIRRVRPRPYEEESIHLVIQQPSLSVSLDSCPTPLVNPPHIKAANKLQCLPRVNIPRDIMRHVAVPSPIGGPVSPMNQSYPFKPIIEDDDDTTSDQRILIQEAQTSESVVDLSPATRSPPTRATATSSPVRSPRTRKPQNHPRLSILLTPPLLATGSREASSRPSSPILAVLEEGYNSCLRAVLRQDALVAAVNRTSNLRISSKRLYYPESLPRSQGAYGDVWIGRLDEKLGETRIVAVKRIRLKPQDGGSNAGLLKSLLQEVIPWYDLSHRNITPFIGYTFDGNDAAMISEWQDNGHIFEYLAKHPRAKRLRMIAQTAEGLAYLHAKRPSLVHGDIKPENVLVSKEGVIKLTDFGLSTILNNSQSAAYLKTISSFRGTIHYADPALLDGYPPTRFTDIWAFAWVTFGILTLRRPYDGVHSESRIIRKILTYDVPNSINFPDLPHGRIIWPVLQASWSRSTKDRWSAGHISRYIRQVM